MARPTITYKQAGKPYGEKSKELYPQ